MEEEREGTVVFGCIFMNKDNIGIFPVRGMDAYCNRDVEDEGEKKKDKVSSVLEHESSKTIGPVAV